VVVGYYKILQFFVWIILQLLFHVLMHTSQAALISFKLCQRKRHQKFLFAYFQKPGSLLIFADDLHFMFVTKTHDVNVTWGSICTIQVERVYKMFLSFYFGTFPKKSIWGEIRHWPVRECKKK